MSVASEESRSTPTLHTKLTRDGHVPSKYFPLPTSVNIVTQVQVQPAVLQALCYLGSSDKALDCYGK